VIVVVEFTCELRRRKQPSRIKRGQEFVELPASTSAKVLLLNEMIRQKVRSAEPARRPQTTPHEVNRLTG
jgi:antitoxin HicB